MQSLHSRVRCSHLLLYVLSLKSCRSTDDRQSNRIARVWSQVLPSLSVPRDVCRPRQSSFHARLLVPCSPDASASLLLGSCCALNSVLRHASQYIGLRIASVQGLKACRVNLTGCSWLLDAAFFTTVQTSLPLPRFQCVVEFSFESPDSSSCLMQGLQSVIAVLFASMQVLRAVRRTLWRHNMHFIVRYCRWIQRLT